MDFSLGAEQEAVRDAANRIFAQELSEKRRQDVAAAGGTDRHLWAALAGAQLLGLAVAEDEGGSGLGLLEIGVLLEEAGRAAAPVPLWPALVLGGLTVSRWGSDAQRRRWLPALVGGDLVLTAALLEADRDVGDPATVASRRSDGWAVDGVKICVPAGTVADVILVPARTGDDVSVLAVASHAPGVQQVPLVTTSGSPQARLELMAARGELVGPAGAGTEILEWLLPRASAGLCALMAGTAQQALRLTAEYARAREQFGRAIATFQAVGQRAADAFVDTEAVTLTARQALWRLAAGFPADEEVAIAKYWAAEGGQRVVHAAQHLHGGIGVDRSYPLHRYFLAAKELELTLGGATANLLRLGAAMADQPV